MSNETIIISDASCLIAFIDSDGLSILFELFGEIIITDIVREEVKHELPDWIKISSDYDESQLTILEINLDRGEASTIALALSEENPLLLLDERKGRKIAKELKLNVIGTLGILIKAKEKGIIKLARPYIDLLIEGDFWVSEALLLKVLERLNEK